MTTREERSRRAERSRRGERPSPGRRARAALAGSACLALVALALPLAAASAADEQAALYQWTDERGNVRYTPDPDRVPSDRRGTLVRLEPGMPAPPTAPRPAAAPTPSAGAPAAAPAPGTTPATATPAAAVPSAPRGDAGAAAPPTAPSGADASREQQLAAEIAADQEALKALIAAPPDAGEPSLADSAQLREIAQRLPRLQAELRALRERRAPPAGP